MTGFTLRTKILFLAFIALFGMGFFAFLNLKQSYDEHSTSLVMQKSSHLLSSASSLVHEMQKERGASSLFIDGAIGEKDLVSYRKNSDLKIEEFSKDVKSSSLKDEQKEMAQENFEKIKILRNDVDKKISVTECISRYVEIIRFILNVEGATASLKTTRGVGKLFVSISILEEAKESAGRLRAGLVSILAKNQAIDMALMEKVIMLKSGIDSNLSSPALSISEKSKQQIHSLLSSEDAHKLNEIFYTIVSKSSSGNFNADPVLFFKTMTNFIDGINTVINDEVFTINMRIDSILLDTKRSVMMTAGLSFFCILVVFAMALKISSNISNVIRSLNTETKSIIESTKQGDLKKRAIALNVNFEFRNIITGINDTLDTIVTSFEQTINAMKELNEKNLTTKVEGKFQGDLLFLQENINTAISELHETMVTVSSSIQQVHRAASQVASGSQALSQGATESAASLEEITSSMSEIGDQTRKNAENALQAKVLSEEAKTSSELGNDKMKKMIEAMNEINQSSEKISKIIKVIDEIAFQTNLLALNAAVEAARAGKHGKGFAVVAQEVRNLAARSAKAAKETTEMIDDSSKKVNGGMIISQETAKALEEIITSTVRVTKLVSEISTASDEQSKGISQIVAALGQIDQVTQKNTATAEESASTAGELSEQANQLKSLVGRFKLN